jgi:hypothetical protein
MMFGCFLPAWSYQHHPTIQANSQAVLWKVHDVSLVQSLELFMIDILPALKDGDSRMFNTQVFLPYTQTLSVKTGSCFNGFLTEYLHRPYTQCPWATQQNCGFQSCRELHSSVQQLHCQANLHKWTRK